MSGVSESELAAKAVAPRVTGKELEDNIACMNFVNFGEAIEALGQPGHPNHRLMTVCVLVLKNGFIVTGESACASPENYDVSIGQRIALANAKDKIWPLMGYELRSQLARTKHDFWMAGSPDCPKDLKASNGELHTLRCKHCGRENPREKFCQDEKGWLDGDERRNGVAQ